MKEPPLEHKLVASDGFKSLVAEREVCSVFADAGWSTLQGSFYIDRTTRKPREMDVVARQVWTRTLKRRLKYLDLLMPCEVKTAKDYHVLFVPATSIETHGYLQRHWIGYDSGKSAVIRALRKVGLNFTQLSAFASNYDEIAYSGKDGGAAALELMIDPPTLQWNATAFRETNTKAMKDLDKSVLWRAGLGLRSSVRALRQRMLRLSVSFVVDEAEYALSVGDDPVEMARQTLARNVDVVEQLHPIVVIDSRLWTLSGPKVVEIPWCRFIQVSPFGQATWWFDVVHSGELRPYVAEVTKSYAKSLLRVRARRSISSS